MEYLAESNIKDLTDLYNGGSITFLQYDEKRGINTIRVICRKKCCCYDYGVDPIFGTFEIVADSHVMLSRIFDIHLCIDKNGYILKGEINIFTVNGEAVNRCVTQIISKLDNIHYSKILSLDINIPDIKFRHSHDLAGYFISAFGERFCHPMDDVMCESDFLGILKDSDEYKAHSREMEVAKTHAYIIKEGLENAGDKIAAPLHTLAYFKMAELALNFPGSKIAMAYRMATGF